MHDGEQWQVFAQNGQAVAGVGAVDDDFDAALSMVMANSHIWLWRQSSGGIEILLQKRALTKKNSPGYFHISAAGHINVGETALEAAVRETREEIGVVIDPELLYLVHVTRAANNWQSLLYVYTYELREETAFSFDDGEVELVEWRSLDEFKEMAVNAKDHKLVDQGAAYFEPLITAIYRQLQ